METGFQHEGRECKITRREHLIVREAGVKGACLKMRLYDYSNYRFNEYMMYFSMALDSWIEMVFWIGMEWNGLGTKHGSQWLHELDMSI